MTAAVRGRSPGRAAVVALLASGVSAQPKLSLTIDAKSWIGQTIRDRQGRLTRLLLDRSVSAAEQLYERFRFTRANDQVTARSATAGCGKLRCFPLRLDEKIRQ